MKKLASELRKFSASIFNEIVLMLNEFKEKKECN
jgi:hypothetical protein